MRIRIALCLAALGVAMGACKSNTTPSCGYNGATQLAATTWPKFRADGANTGRADVDLSGSRGVPTVLLQGFCATGANLNLPCQTNDDCPQFSPTPTTALSPSPTATSGTPASGTPAATATPTRTAPPTATAVACMAMGAVVASPVLSESTVYTASTDGNVYELLSTGNVVRLGISGPILGTPLVGANGNLFVPGNGTLTEFFPDGSVNHQTGLSGIVSGSPNLWSSDGVVYIGTQGGEFAGVCPNGISRFAVGFPSTQSSPAVVQDPHLQPGDLRPISVGGGASGIVRAYDIKGRQYYSFTATANIIASIVVDDSANPRVFYVADTNGRLFMVNLTSGQSAVQPTTPIFTASYCSVTPNLTSCELPGRGCPTGEHCIRTQIIASPALSSDANGTMYVADNSGVLYALNRSTGVPLWNYPDTPPPPQRRITSSPAVATGGTADVVVFAVDYLNAQNVPDRSRMIALVDNGDSYTPFPTWHSADGVEGVPVCGTVGTSANAFASSPSIGPDGTVYIGLSAVGDPAASECDGVVASNGGALAAILP